MKILFCIDTMSKGGAERVIANLSNKFIENNEIEILLLNKSKTEYYISPNVNISYIYNTNAEMNILEKIFYFINTIKEYKEKISNINPDIIISFLPYSSFFSIIAGKTNNKKIIISVRNDPKMEYSKLKEYLLMKILYRFSDGFVFQTEEAKKYFSKKIQKRSAIIPNPINKDFFCEEFNGIRKKKIVTVGRLEEQKNHFLLIKAFKELVKEKKDYKLYIYGDGSKKQDISNFIKEEGLDKYVELKGNVENIKEEIYDAKCFVLSSLYEGMPNALMEALALGIPCIATDCPCGGSRFLIDNYTNGILVKNNCKKELISALEKIIEDEKFANNCGVKSREKMKEFSVDNINKKWIEYIKKIYNT